MAGDSRRLMMRGHWVCDNLCLISMDLNANALSRELESGSGTSMTLAEFKRSLTKRTPPVELSPALTGLWWAGKDQWDTAHSVVMDEEDKDCARVHAYLHRLEKDDDNARYWYRRAGTSMASGPFQAEWDAIARDLLAKSS
jgi:hypothetical protein